MQEDGKKYRLEHDSIGEKEVPEDAYYGVQTLRENASGADQQCGTDQEGSSHHQL